MLNHPKRSLEVLLYLALKRMEKWSQGILSHQTQRLKQISQRFQQSSVLKSFLAFISTKTIQNGKDLLSRETLVTTLEFAHIRTKQYKLEAMEVKTSILETREEKIISQTLSQSEEQGMIICKQALNMTMRCMEMKERTICKAGLAMTSSTEVQTMIRSEVVAETTCLMAEKARM